MTTSVCQFLVVGRCFVLYFQVIKFYYIRLIVTKYENFHQKCPKASIRQINSKSRIENSWNMCKQSLICNRRGFQFIIRFASKYIGNAPVWISLQEDTKHKYLEIRTRNNITKRYNICFWHESTFGTAYG